MPVLSLVCRTVSSRSSTRTRSALGNRPGPGIKLAAAALTTDGSESLATDTDEVRSAHNSYATRTNSNTGIAIPAQACSEDAFAERVLGPHAENRIAAFTIEKNSLDGKRPITEGLTSGAATARQCANGLFTPPAATSRPSRRRHKPPLLPRPSRSDAQVEA